MYLANHNQISLKVEEKCS